MTDTLPLSTPPSAFEPSRGARWPRYVFLTGCAGYVVLIVLAMFTARFDYIDPVVQLPILLFLAGILARWIARVDNDPEMVPFVIAAFSAKMLGAMVRYILGYVLYHGQVDSADYQAFGRSLAPMYRSLDFSQHVGGSSGTPFMRITTGVVYAVTGSSPLGGFFIFSFFSFVGLLLLWRGFCRAVPGGDHRMYGLLVLFLPSVLYWPSALGKEAWALLTIGLASYGVARVLTRAIPSGLLFFALGLLGVTLLRPHIALTMFCGLALAAAVAKSRRGTNGAAPVVRMIVFGALLGLGVILLSQANGFFGVQNLLNEESLNKTLAKAAGQTAQANSSFTAIQFRPNNPLTWVGATGTVLFRPLPFEARNVESLFVSAESIFIFVLMVRRRRRLRSLWREMRDHPYVAYCLGTTITFIMAFSAFSNFGILSRERVQVIPFFVVFMCLPEWTPKNSKGGDELLARADPGSTSGNDLGGRRSPYGVNVVGPYDHADLSAPNPYGGVEPPAYPDPAPPEDE